MKLISWNVNGIRACLNKGFLNSMDIESPDIICLQETKAHPDQVDLSLGTYECFWNSAEKKGYSGTAIFSKIKPISVINGIGKEEHDNEGRVITAEFDDFFLVNVYVPNAKRGLLRLDYRMNWEDDFRSYILRLEEKKPVIVCGDLNVAHQEIDLANPSSNRMNPGFTDEERAKFSELLGSGYIDTFRLFESGGGHYSWWSYMFNARAKNIGWRIDYWVVSEKLKKMVKSSKILPHVIGSDHCPVVMELE